MSTTASATADIHLFSGSPPGYLLLELPPEIAKLFEDAGDGRDEERRAAGLTIKGRQADDAVLCTSDKTYSLRQIVQSNSLLLLSADSRTAPEPEQGQRETARVGESDGQRPRARLTLRDNLETLIELVPVVPRLERIEGILSESAYKGPLEEEEEEEQENGRQRKRRKYTAHQLRSVVQASDGELQKGLDEKRVVLLDGYYRLLHPPYLSTVLDALLTTITAEGMDPRRLDTQRLIDALESEHDVRPEIGRAVLGWYSKPRSDGAGVGASGGTEAELDQKTVIQFMGLEILMRRARTSIPLETFMSEWKKKVGDSLADEVDLKLLEGNHLIEKTSPSTPPTILYFPSSALSTDASIRFNELFLTRTAWRAEEIRPYLKDVAVDDKKRDALLMKFARATKHKDGSMTYTARSRV